MASVNVYLTFNGNCEEAFNFYKSVFGGEFPYIGRFKEMPPQEGMVFVFEQPSQQCFWMKNTPLPLSAAFVADDGRIVNLVDMKAQTLDTHCSQEPVRYVLEMNQGWFAKKGIKAGSKLGGDLFQRSR